ncbi:protein TRI1-like [Impatiens glandulifera]|uniref:protein TRI1-like n=1 Tax=Impatiens glandulifera TaxID=253017 RepID=UPI001FB0C501|nr:protein TRI1-like [Impatiens glandulifera]
MASFYTRVFGAGRTVLMAAAESAAAAKIPTSGAAAAVERRPLGIMKPMQVSPALNDFLGVPEAARSDVMKKVWDYIKLHNLQNPSNRREILCDDKLKTIFDGKEKVGMLEIAKLLSPHFIKQ